MKNIVIVRHGESEGNLDEERCRDDSLNFLTQRGTLQAQLAGITLKHIGFPIDSVLCSPMLRARQTCSHIVQNADIKTPIQIMNCLQECRLFDSTTGLITLEAADKIKQLRMEGNVLVVMHYFSMNSFIKNFGLELHWRGCENAVLNVISPDNTITYINGNKSHRDSYGQ